MVYNITLMTHRYPLDHPRVTEIAVDRNINLDTHSTGGEHALKESGSWRTYNHNLAQAGSNLPDGIEDTLEHYFYSGIGHFYRAYVMEDDGSSWMTAGMTATRTPDLGLSVDSFFCQAVQDSLDQQEELAFQSIIASSIERMLSRNVFDQFSGIQMGGYRMPASYYFDIPFSSIGHIVSPDADQTDFAFLRGISDYAIATDSGFRIPMPGRVIEINQPVPAEALESELHAKMPEGFNGMLTYNPIESPDQHIEEFWRARKLIATLVSTHEGWERRLELQDGEGQALDLPHTYERYESGSLRVQILKLIAENDEEIAALVLN